MGTVEENITTMRRHIDAMNDCVNMASKPESIYKRLNEFVSSDYVLHTAGGDMDLEQDVQFHSQVWTAFPDTHYQLEDIFGADDKVFARFTVTCTHKGTFRGILPTGKQLFYVSADCIKFKDGKISDVWGFTDMLEIYRQLGVITSMREIIEKFNENLSVKGE